MKKKYIFILFIISSFSGLFLYGCQNNFSLYEELSTFSSETNEVIHNVTTISTENDTENPQNMQHTDTTEDFSLPLEPFSSEEASAESSAENTEESSETQTHTNETLNPLSEEASYYFKFYVSVYVQYNEEMDLSMDEKQFWLAYHSIKNETLENYFSVTEWISREEGISLSLYPNNILLPQNNPSVYLWIARNIHAFELITAAYETDERWEHADSLKPQYHCHALYARDQKVPWNIEPYRTETNFLKILLAQGNP